MPFLNDINECIKRLNTGGLILYPTDTIWGIGCDATNKEAVAKIFALKQRQESKSMIILLSDKKDISKYVNMPAEEILNYISIASHPVTAIYENGKNVADNLITGDGSIAIRITRDAFCIALINKLTKPLVSTSANISGKPAPLTFKDIGEEIKNGVDYIVQHRQSDLKIVKPSEIIRIADKKIVVLRP